MPHRETLYRHPLPVRIWHWMNVMALTVMLGSGLQILNAHPAFYWNSASSDSEQASIAFEARSIDGHLKGYTRVGHVTLETTGVLGVSQVDGESSARAFPSWATIPGFQDLAAGRLWHFFFAWVFVLNGFAYVFWGVARRHIRRDLLPSRDQLRPSHIWAEVREHARLRFARGDEARRYNVLQKGTYLLVLFGLLPMMIGTGLTMAPGIDAAWPWLLELFGGRQAARTLHFLTAAGLVLFVLLHVVLVVVSGLFNNIRSMITGWYVIDLGDAS